MADLSTPIRFIDLQAQRARIKTDIDNAVHAVLDHGQYVMGPEVFQLEKELSSFTGARETVTCASGTDALVMVLMAKKVGPGCAVFVPSFTFAASAESIALVGATPYFVDVRRDTMNMCPESLKRAIPAAREAGLTPKAVIAVDLFGLPADYDALSAIAAEHDLDLIADAAQSFGATSQARRVGTLAPVTTTSFFPAKPLGCYGDGGAIFTDDAELAEVLRSVRVHGQGQSRYEHVRLGVTGRLDTIQAAILLQKLRIFPEEVESRQSVASRYSAGLSDILGVQLVTNDMRSVWAQYTLVLNQGGREEVLARLGEAGIPTAVYYPTPLHRQPAYNRFPGDPSGLANTMHLAERVFSLPMHPYLDAASQDRIINAVREVVKQLAN